MGRSRSRGRRDDDRGRRDERPRGDDRGRRDERDERDRGRDDRRRDEAPRDEERPRDRDRSRGREGRDEKAKPDEGRDRGSTRKEEEDKPDDDEFRVGRQVIVKGLQNNPEKNGSIGLLVEFNKDKGRWVVELSGGKANFKEDNLELMPDNSDVLDEKEEPPTAKIYITKLSAETTEQDLQKLFSGCGVIAKQPPKKARDKGFEDQWPFAVKLYKPGKEQGDGCVTFMDSYAAKAAIKTYNRYKFKGSKIGVAYAGQGRVYEQVELQLPWHMRPENAGKIAGEDGEKGGGKAGGKPGDWVCPGCGSNVFASKDSCFKCGESKPSGGGGGKGGGKDDDGGKGGGKDDKGGKGGKDDKGGKGGKAGDWNCPGCGANVFASKDSCFKCGASKPDGGGGGKGGGKGKW